jgi:hypothetical protein
VDDSLKMGHVCSGSGLVVPVPSPTTPWDSGIGDLRSSMEAPRVPPTKATQYMSQRLMRAWGSEMGSMFHEGVWPPPGEGATLVNPRVRSI